MQAGINIGIKDYVLNEDGYEWLSEEYKRKSRRYQGQLR